MIDHYPLPFLRWRPKFGFSVQAGDGDDTISLSGSYTGSTTNVIGGNGSDTMSFATSGAPTVTFAGGAGADTLNVNSGTFTLAQDAQLSSESLSINLAGTSILLNLDKMVTISDFIDLSSNFDQMGSWRQGDGNYDKTVTISDFIDLAANFGQSLVAPGAIAQQLAASQQLAVDPPSRDTVADEPDVFVLKKDRRLNFDRPSRHHQLHHRRQKHKTLKWRTRAEAY
ncbi:MAG TPA: hypothetical protein VGQ99_22165 [Tepidisphaeraceae bacterium]|nr:hypothetical protein [Tepidisphaeraceae bacterium]